MYTNREEEEEEKDVILGCTNIFIIEILQLKNIHSGDIA